MALYLSQVTIPMDSLVPKDAVMNTFHVECSGADLPAARAAWHAALIAFYNNVSDVYSIVVSQNGWVHKMYDLDQPKPRAPVDTFTWNLAVNPTGAELPHELAFCISFQAARVSGVPQARRRGRIYLGPVDTAGISTSMISPTMIPTLKTAAAGLLAASQSSAIFEWIVYSPTAGIGAAVVDGWIDNAVDIQRRRGIAATTRTIFP
jgi:hypothetical protein